jgi:hypothetical protein
LGSVGLFKINNGYTQISNDEIEMNNSIDVTTDEDESENSLNLKPGL